MSTGYKNVKIRADTQYEMKLYATENRTTLLDAFDEACRLFLKAKKEGREAKKTNDKR
jgi:hypothetical protein